jgi:hypothetical protein
MSRQWPCVLRLLYGKAHDAERLRWRGHRSPAFGRYLLAHCLAVGWRARLGVFRSFNPSASRLTRNVLLPILAGYGDVSIVFDPTLEDVEGESFLGEATPELEQIATVHRFDNTEWRARVGELIARTDITVIEATRLTPGVAWEFARCLKELPPWRVYPVAHLDGLDGVPLAEHVKTVYAVVGQESEMPRGVRTRWFYLGLKAFQKETVAADVHEKMSSIIAIESGLEDPSAFGPGAAAWLPAHAG